jgi:glycolate oxidase FAD binding subunit
MARTPASMTTADTATLHPRTIADLHEALRWAAAEQLPLELVSGGGKRAIGQPMQTAGVLDLSGLAGLRDYDPPELVLTCGAATPMAEIAAALAEACQQLAFEPMDSGPLLGLAPGLGTLAGTLGADFAGPRRVKSGAGRDHLLGFKGVTGRGELFKAGGRVVKNVTGYDICKLVTGAWGTLVAFDELSVKVLPAPETVQTLLLLGLDLAAGRAAMSAGLSSSHDVSGAAHLPAAIAARVASVASAGTAVTALRLEGFTTSVAARVEALSRELTGLAPIEALDEAGSRALWADLRDVRPLAPPHTDLAGDAVWRISVPPTEGPAVVAAIAGATDAQAWLDWGGGLIWLALSCGLDGGEQLVRGALKAHASSGHATLVRAPATVRAAVPVFQPLPAPLTALSERLKDQFDPHRVLNPGRLV